MPSNFKPITADIIEKNANKAEYQKTNNSNSESQYEMLKNLEFSSQNSNI